jgi:drug/metabolite transporter (DMT)-like permease
MSVQITSLATAMFYAACLIFVRRGLRYSTPLTGTCVSVTIHGVSLSTAVLLSGGIPDLSPVPVLLFVMVGVFQLGTRLTAYTGIGKIGASRSSTIQSTSPLISAALGILLLHEHATMGIAIGTALVITGILFVVRRPNDRQPEYRRWHLLYPLTAAFLTGINHPIRRFALLTDNYPLFFAAFMGVVAFLAVAVYLILRPKARKALVWNRRSLPLFVMAGTFETLAIWMLIISLGSGAVVIVAPVTATYPLWVTLGTALFSRAYEQVNVRTVVAAGFVVAGVSAIFFG